MLHLGPGDGISLVASLAACLMLVLVSAAAGITCCPKKSEKKEDDINARPRYENVGPDGKPLAPQSDLEAQSQKPSAYENVGADGRPLAPQPGLGGQQQRSISSYENVGADGRPLPPQLDLGNRRRTDASAAARNPPRGISAGDGMPAAASEDAPAAPKHRWDSTRYPMTTLQQDQTCKGEAQAPPAPKHRWDGESYDMTSLADQDASAPGTWPLSFVVGTSSPSSVYGRVTVSSDRQQDPNRPVISEAARFRARQLQEQKQQAQSSVQANASSSNEGGDERERISVSSGAGTFVVTDRETVRGPSSKQRGARPPLPMSPSVSSSYTYAVPRNTVGGTPDSHRDMSAPSSDSSETSPAFTGIEVHTEGGAALTITDASETDTSQQHAQQRRVILDFAPYS